MAVDVQNITAPPEAEVRIGPAERLAQAGGWWTPVLAVIMLFGMTEALAAAAWSDGLELVRLCVLGGAALGFVLSLTRWGGLFAAIYATLSSVPYISTLFDSLIFKSLSGREAFAELVRRNADWMVALVNRNASADNLIFVTQLAFLGWWIGYLAMWSLVRHQRLFHAILPAGAGLLVNAYFTSANMTPYIITYLGAALLLAIRVELARNETRWQLTRVRYAPDITLDFLKAGLVFAGLVILFAWAAPDLTDQLTAERLLRPFEKPWQTIEDTWSRMYRSLNYGRGVYRPPSYGKAHNLGGPISLTDRPVFQAETPERTYWRAAVYDRYDGAGWLNTDSEIVIVEHDTALGEPMYAQRYEITATVRPLEQGQDVIFSPPQPLRVSVPVNADATILRDDPREVSVSLLRSRIDLERRGGYQIVAAVTNASVDRLRADNGPYPDWVRERYLQLPATVPFRVTDLAMRITTAYNNAYDKTEAVELVLRTYSYNTQIQAPPAGSDSVDYFLFETRQGYCDYYASAMVVMLRSVGIPARLAMGYAPGEIVPPQAGQPGTALVYRVVERNAHAWPEVFFPTYGWIQFEPTASEPRLTRPLPPPEPGPEAGQLPDDRAGMGRSDDLLSREDRLPEPAWVAASQGPWAWLARSWGLLVVIAALLVVAAAGAAYSRRRRAALFGDPQVVVRLFGMLGTWAARLRIPWLPSQTPLERAAQFTRVLPEAAPAVNDLTELFVAQLYGRQEPSAVSLGSLSETWRRLQPRLWRRWLVGEAGSARRRGATTHPSGS